MGQGYDCYSDWDDLFDGRYYEKEIGYYCDGAWVYSGSRRVYENSSDSDQIIYFHSWDEASYWVLGQRSSPEYYYDDWIGYDDNYPPEGVFSTASAFVLSAFVENESSSEEFNIASYGVSNPQLKLGTNFSNILTYCKFNTIYEGQYEASGSINYLFGDAKEENNKYFISFYADQAKQYKIFEYSSVESSGDNILITGSGVGVGASGYFSYDLGI